jgi:hypothetical protein
MGRQERYMQSFGELTEKDHLEKQVVDARIISNRILKKMG